MRGSGTRIRGTASGVEKLSREVLKSKRSHGFSRLGLRIFLRMFARSLCFP